MLRLPEIAPSLEALRTERVLDLQDAAASAAIGPLAEHALSGRSASALVAAAIRSAGELVGVLLAAQFTTPRPWESDEIVFLCEMADQVAQVLGSYQREQFLEELRVLAGELMRSQDEERRRIGRELHDSTGQSLAALELDLGRLLSSADALAPEKRTLLETCAQLAHQCSSEIRTASYLLHPPLLDELGLVSALRWLTDGLRQRSNIEVRLDLPATMARMPREQELALFRVAQEALTNVHRHSASPWVAVRLAGTSGTIRLEVEDAGRGLSPELPRRAADSKPPLGVGLAGMRERMRQMGGTLQVEFRSTGTLIRATLPIPVAKSAASI
jgi:signal transduction histidine kinase